ncbi:hypothetical protein KIPB_015314, partial [Kipferlia bialata]|eukprot:g15314.t1
MCVYSPSFFQIGDTIEVSVVLRDATNALVPNFTGVAVQVIGSQVGYEYAFYDEASSTYK